MYKTPASLRSDFSECRFARIECHFVSESVAISSEYTGIPFVRTRAIVLMPPCLREWLPEDHLAYFVSDLVDDLDLSEIEAVYEERSFEDVAFRVLAAGNTPDFLYAERILKDSPQDCGRCLSSYSFGTLTLGRSSLDVCDRW